MAAISAVVSTLTWSVLMPCSVVVLKPDRPVALSERTCDDVIALSWSVPKLPTCEPDKLLTCAVVKPATLVVLKADNCAVVKPPSAVVVIDCSLVLLIALSCDEVKELNWPALSTLKEDVDKFAA